MRPSVVDDLLGEPEADETEFATQPPVAVSLGDLERPVENDHNELLKSRYLCRGGGLLLVGPPGVGKGSLAMQAKLL